MVIAYANGYEGYLPFRHDLAAGGYEAQTGSAHFKPGTAERILDAVLRGLERSLIGVDRRPAGELSRFSGGRRLATAWRRRQAGCRPRRRGGAAGR